MIDTNFREGGEKHLRTFPKKQWNNDLSIQYRSFNLYSYATDYHTAYHVSASVRCPFRFRIAQYHIIGVLDARFGVYCYPAAFLHHFVDGHVSPYPMARKKGTSERLCHHPRYFSLYDGFFRGWGRDWV